MRKLNIGSRQKYEGWETFDIAGGADYVGDAIDMSRFADETFDEIYASHILEHFKYTGQIQVVLREWHRILKFGGTFYVSVPHFEILCKLFLTKDKPIRNIEIVRLILGSQINSYHYMVFDCKILTGFLKEAGFTPIERVSDFGLFQDTSTKTVCGHPISLNIIAKKEE